MSKKSRSKAAAVRKTLLVTCAVLVVILIGSLAALGLLIYNEDSMNANVRNSVTVEAGTAAIDPVVFLVEPDEEPVTFAAGVSAQQLATPGTYPVSITWHKKTYDRVCDVVKDHFSRNETLILGELRDILGTSRKYAMAVLEYYDKNRITKKDGDVRRLAGFRE